MKSRPRSGAYQLVLATDAPPLGSGANRFPLGRAHAALMHSVASRQGVWVAASQRMGGGGSWLKPVLVDADTLAAHRAGYCATTLAGVYFGQAVMPEQRPEWLQAHREVCEHYARTIARLAAPDALVWLHDHHLQLVAARLRDLRPDVRIGVTMHSPFPHAESFMTLAEREDIIASLRSADLIGFQESRSVANFQALADEPQFTIGERCHRTKAVVMPMPADSGAMAHLAHQAEVRTAAARIRASLRPATTIFLSMGGNDPADGSAFALQEFAKLFSSKDLDPRRVAYIHLAPTAPFPGADSQTQRQEVERLVAKINGEFASPGHCPVHYQRRDIAAAELTALYLAADVMLATPLRDRATPQAAEYAAVHADGRGQIIMSEFSSTRHQLDHAKPVNPHEPAALGDAIVAAVHKTKGRCAAMLAMHERVAADGVSAWARDFLHLLAGDNAHQLTRSIVKGSVDSAQRSDYSSRLTATTSHP